METLTGRNDYKYFVDINTRWMDNDIYGHVNNVTYYSYFDTTANKYLIEKGGLDIHKGNIIGFVVASSCQYYAPIAYPETIEVGLRVDRIGNSSVTYGLAIFKKDSDKCVANGSFTHVFVNRDTNQSVAIPDALRVELSKISR